MSQPATTRPAPAATDTRDTPPHRYTAALAGEIETRWQERWEREQTFRQPNPGETGFDAARPKFYCLDMFPYPSGSGLHIGHPEGYTATDIISRYKRMRGFNVLHPMGWDAFGLPAEQYAIQTGIHPAVTTRQAIETFRRQLRRFGFSYDWSRELGTIDEGYYRWTQWLFLRLYDAWYDRRAGENGRARPVSELVRELEAGKIPARTNPDAAEYGGGHAGARKPPVLCASWAAASPAQRREIIDSYRLAYVAESTVNWCPKLGTALANEEVIDGKSERGNFPVLRKPLKQWLFRITAYADRLLDDLRLVSWPESTRAMQAEWIGRSEGAEIGFEIPDRKAGMPALRVFTTRPDTIFGATFMVVAPEHPIIEEVLRHPVAETDAAALRAYVQAAKSMSDVERQERKDKTGVFTGLYATNPATGRPIPVWTADYVLTGYGTGAIMAVPGQDQRDWEFARAFGLPIVRTVQPPPGFDGEAFVGDGPAVNSGFLDGLHVAEAKSKAVAWLEETGRGTRRVNYRLRDWLFSRQRYWGEPFPIVYDDEGNHHAVSESLLPVRLPDLKDFAPEESDEPRPLLAKAAAWVHTTAGAAGVRSLPHDASVRRETNTMPNWAGSCWYYLRYCDPRNTDRFVGSAAQEYWLGTPPGVDLYVGGAEHAVLHLLYARFWHKALFDLGDVSTPEPFSRLFHQGLITSYAYQTAEGSLVPADQVFQFRHDKDAGGFAEVFFHDDKPAHRRIDSASLPRAAHEALTTNGSAFVWIPESASLDDWKMDGVALVERVTAKMSKSLKNVVNPDDVIADYGADTVRLYEMYMGPLEASKPWNPRDISGLFRFLQRAWRLIIDEQTGSPRLRDEPDPAVERQLHRTTAKAAADIERLAFNTAIAAMIEFVNAATSAGGLTRGQAERFALVLAPFAPHVAEELWSRLGHAGSLAHQPWPAHDEAMLHDDTVELPVQIGGKVRARIIVPANAAATDIEAAVLVDEKVKAMLEGKTVRKVIVIPGKMVNIVAG